MLSEKLLEPLDSFLKLSQKYELRYMLIGGFALQFWTHGRTTRDLDVTILLDRVNQEQFKKLMTQQGFKIRKPRSFFHPAELLLFSYKAKGLELDLEFDVTLATTPYQKIALERAIALPWLNKKVRVITPEDLVLHKLTANQLLDVFDASETIKEQEDKLDYRYLKLWAKKLNISQRLEKLLKEK